MYFDQKEFQIRCEWGLSGIENLAPHSDVLIIVDILSFSTAVDVAVGRGATIYPYPWKDDGATAFAASKRALLASRERRPNIYCLAPVSFREIPSGTRLVLPSPNGSTLSLTASGLPTIAGSIRNAAAVALAAMRMGKRISVIPAGEKWPNGALRPSFEDWLGAGAILSYLKGTLSPESHAAIAVFEKFHGVIEELLLQCGTGKELVEQGYRSDIVLAAELNESIAVPLLMEGAYTDHSHQFGVLSA